MRFLAICLILVGCAARVAAIRSSPYLCYQAYAGRPALAEAARGELASRGFTCNPQDVEMGQREAIAEHNRPKSGFSCHTVGQTTNCY